MVYASLAGVTIGVILLAAFAVRSSSRPKDGKPPLATATSSLKGKIVFITGGSAGLGKRAALELAHCRPAQIWLTGRHLARLQSAAAEIRQALSPDEEAPHIHLLTMDLGSFKSIRAACDTFLSESHRLDILMLNAGVMSVPAGMTQDGYEIQFGTNHMGHALVTKLLEPALYAARGAGPPRVVVLSSSSHHDVPPGGIRWDSLKTPGTDVFLFKRYGQSKLANALFARELARRRPWLLVAAVHPGVVRGTEMQASATGIPLVLRYLIASVRLLFTISLDEGVKNQVWAALAEGYPSGEYFEPVGRPGQASAHATDDDMGGRLWEWTESELESWLSAQN